MNLNMYHPTKLHNSRLLVCVQRVQHIKNSIFSFLFCLPTSVLALILFLLILHNGFSVFYVHLPLLPANSRPENPANSPPETPPPAGKPLPKIGSLAMYAVKGETHLTISLNSTVSRVPSSRPVVLRLRKLQKKKVMTRVLRLGPTSKQFPARVKEFFKNSRCKSRFFVTWISSLESFGDREVFVLESLFKSHPNACLVIVSSSMDSNQGNQILRPFSDRGFRVIAAKPDFDYLFKNTPADLWFRRLREGNVDPGEVSLGQNLSNLLRLALLYKFGGTYLDTDVVVLKSFGKLRNAIGAQTIDLGTGNWSRLNNAVLIFDKRHPLLFKFIQEFALTFDGNKWGHNGPYLVSRVVSRVQGRPGFEDVNVLPPSAFYPVNWSRVRSIFKGPRGKLHSVWLDKKFQQIKEESFAVHLWNKQSRRIKVEDGSIIGRIMSNYCIFCNYTTSSLYMETPRNNS